MTHPPVRVTVGLTQMFICRRREPLFEQGLDLILPEEVDNLLVRENRVSLARASDAKKKEEGKAGGPHSARPLQPPNDLGLRSRHAGIPSKATKAYRMRSPPSPEERIISRRLLSEHQHHEGIRQNRRTRVRLLRCWRRRRPEFRGHGINLMRLAVQGHRTGTPLGGNIFSHAELVR